MNVETTSHIADAIIDAEEDILMVTGMLVGFTYIDLDGSECKGYFQMPDQSSIITNGLADMITYYARQNLSHEDH